MPLPPWRPSRIRGTIVSHEANLSRVSAGTISRLPGGFSLSLPEPNISRAIFLVSLGMGFALAPALAPSPLLPRPLAQVVFACPADVALSLLGEEATDEERDALGRFEFSENTIYVHRYRWHPRCLSRNTAHGEVAVPKSCLGRVS